MNKALIAILGMATVLAVGTSLAQEAKPPTQSPKAAQAASGMDVKGQMAKMDEHMKKMQALHEKMMSATTPEERQKAMEDARKEMQEGMSVMQPMMQGGMMGGMGGGMMAHKGAPDASTQMQMMDKRMDMMQMMMQMMMDQQGMMMGGAQGPGMAPKK